MVMLKSTARHPHGLVSWSEPSGKLIERDTFRCCHCQYTILVRPGSGTMRGFCFMCNAPTCGRHQCSQGCEPFEAKLEAWEGRRRFAKSLGGY